MRANILLVLQIPLFLQVAHKRAAAQLRAHRQTADLVQVRQAMWLAAPLVPVLPKELPVAPAF